MPAPPRFRRFTPPRIERVPAEGPRRWIGWALLGAFLLAVSGGLVGFIVYAVRMKPVEVAKAPVVTPPVVVPEVKVKPAPKEEWLSPPAIGKFGPVRVHIDRAFLDKMVVLAIPTYRTDHDVLSIPVYMASTDEKSKIDYVSWNDSNRPSLTDEFDNQYSLITFRPWQVAGQISRATLYGDHETVSDVLVFERPVPAAKWLYLTLDGAALGQPGQLRFRLATSALTKWGEKKD